MGIRLTEYFTLFRASTSANVLSEPVPERTNRTGEGGKNQSNHTTAGSLLWNMEQTESAVIEVKDDPIREADERAPSHGIHRPRSARRSRSCVCHHRPLLDSIQSQNTHKLHSLIRHERRVVSFLHLSFDIEGPSRVFLSRN